MKWWLLLLLLLGAWIGWRVRRKQPEGLYMDQLRAVWKVKP